jgi:hypothetical protein
MDQPADTRKQVHLLTPDDFARSPVWEFVPDNELASGEDQATVRQCSEIGAAGLYVLAADAILPDGAALPGYVYAGDPNDPADVQPHLLLAGAQVNFWFGSLRFRGGPEEFVNAAYAILSQLDGAIFPIRFTTRVPVDGAPLTVVVTGFKASDHHDQVIAIG